MFCRKYINGSVKWLGIPNFLRNDGPPWTLNILDTYAKWGYRGSSTSPNLGSVSGGYPDSVSINWNCPTCVLLIYQRRIFDNTRSAAHRARDYLLMENCTYRTENPSTCHNSIRGSLVKRQDDALDNLWDFSVRQ